MSNSNNNQINIPQTREAGSVGGQMVVPYEVPNLIGRAGPRQGIASGWNT